MGKSTIITTIALLAIAACAANPFPKTDPLWKDEGDFRPYAKMPEEYKVSTFYDGVDETLFRPLTRFFRLDADEPARNVNAWDEVPDSSWFTNRMGNVPLSPEEVAQGACDTPLDTKGPFTVLSGKPDGFNPGFLVKAPNGKKYFFKFDQHELQPERMSSAEVIGSLLYHAVGFTVPCYEVLYFDKSALVIDKDAKVKNSLGQKVKMTQADVDKAFSLVKLAADGKVRAVSSLLLEGKVIGPWTYAGKKSDDPNDVIPHEHRRELRAGYVLASWISHFDTRDQNTLATWMEDPQTKKGYVRHNLLDFGDSLGNLADNDAISRRLGYAHYFDMPYIAADFVTFGLVTRPWDDVQFGKAGPVLGYYDIEQFVPDEWQSGYPNPAFRRMTEKDAAWMARIISRFSDAHIRAMVARAKMKNAVASEQLVKIISGRRDKLLSRWFQEVSPLAHPRLRVTEKTAEICLEDLAMASGVLNPKHRKWIVTSEGVSFKAHLHKQQVCVALPESPLPYRVLEWQGISPENPDERPLQLHLYATPQGYRVAGIER